MNGQILIAALGSASLAAVAGAVVTGLFNRRRLSADATKIITDAASGVVTMLKEDNAEKDKRIGDLEARAQKLERHVGELETALSYERSAQQAVNQMHAAWDFLAYEDIKSNGNKGNLPAPPPLYPPPASRVAPRS